MAVSSGDDEFIQSMNKEIKLKRNATVFLQ